MLLEPGSDPYQMHLQLKACIGPSAQDLLPLGVELQGHCALS